MPNPVGNVTENIVLTAEELRCTAREIGKLTGEVGIEDVLTELFQGFCIGK